MWISFYSRTNTVDRATQWVSRYCCHLREKVDGLTSYVSEFFPGSPRDVGETDCRCVSVFLLTPHFSHMTPEVKEEVATEDGWKQWTFQ